MFTYKDSRRLSLFSFFSRKFVACLALAAGAALLVLLSVPCSSADAGKTSQREYRLHLYETHTHEQINIIYRRGNAYLPDAVRRLDHFLRDHRNGEVHAFNPRLFDVLYALTKSVARPGIEIQVICGYRSPGTNEFLHRTTVGVASHSLHMLGEAIDIRIPGVSTAQLRAAALRLHDGGVGYYPHSRFVHVDVGRVRQWALAAD
jgi:uncharacterized protein YcbK (DUF882 family)